MIYYEVDCSHCKQTFKVYEGTQDYLQYKKNMKKEQPCGQCKHKIELESRLYFFRR